MGQLSSSLRNWCRRNRIDHHEPDITTPLSTPKEDLHECTIPPEKVAEASNLSMACDDFDSSIESDDDGESGSESSDGLESEEEEKIAASDDSEQSWATISHPPSSSPSSFCREHNTHEEEEEEEEVSEHNNIYFDPFHIRVKFDTPTKTDKDIARAIATNYQRLCQETRGKFVHQLGKVLEGVDVPSSATYMIVNLVTFAHDHVNIPFDLSRLDDMFPCDDPNLLMEECVLPDSISLLHEVDGELRSYDVTNKLEDFSHRVFRPGSNLFRPHAWRFFQDLSADKNAILMLKYFDANTHEYFCATMSLYGEEDLPQIQDWYNVSPCQNSTQEQTEKEEQHEEKDVPLPGVCDKVEVDLHPDRQEEIKAL